MSQSTLTANAEAVNRLAEAGAAAFPAIASRAAKAAALVLSGAVELVDRPAGYDGNRLIATVAGGRPYSVQQLRNGRLYCNCADHAYRAPERNGEKLCKHLIAVRILRELAAETADRLPDGARYAEAGESCPKCGRSYELPEVVGEGGACWNSAACDSLAREQQEMADFFNRQALRRQVEVESDPNHWQYRERARLLSLMSDPRQVRPQPDPLAAAEAHGLDEATLRRVSSTVGTNGR